MQGLAYSTSAFSSLVNAFDNNQNYFDVFPPTGKTMSDLKGFICSIAMIHFGGDVNSDDSLRCIWEVYPSNGSDRIRVWVQNTEQRSLPAANWIAFWG